MTTLMEHTSEKEVKQDIHPNEETEIDLMDILRKVIRIRKKIYKAIGIGLLIGIVVAISIPKQYTVTVTLSPEMGSAKKVVCLVWRLLSWEAGLLWGMSVML